MSTGTGVRAKIDIGMPDETREAVGQILNTLLADEFVLYTKTRNYHWNVVGPQFRQLHKLFEEQYEQLNEIVDEVAERARQFDIHARGTLREFMEQTNIQEHPGSYPSAERMIFGLLDDQEMVIRWLRTNADVCADRYHDMGTNDFLLGLMEKHEEMAWMLRAHLEENQRS